MIVNGKEAHLQKPATLEEYLNANGYDCAQIAIEKNGAIVPRESFASERLFDGDKMEIVCFMGGG